MEATGTKKRSGFQRVKRTFRRRWVQVCIVLLFWLLVMALTVKYLGPKTFGKGEKDTTKYNFLHCDNCKMELPYNKEMEGKRCPKCQPPKTEGFFVPSEISVKSRLGEMSPWSKVYVGTFVETVAMLGIVTYLLYRTVPDPASQFFVVACPYCNQRLRYRALSHGGLGSCSRCKRMLRFPDEEDAVSEADIIKAEEEAALAEAARLEAEARAADAEQQ